MGHTLIGSMPRASLLQGRPAGFPRLVRPEREDLRVVRLLVVRPTVDVPGPATSPETRDEEAERWDGLA